MEHGGEDEPKLDKETQCARAQLVQGSAPEAGSIGTVQGVPQKREIDRSEEIEIVKLFRKHGLLIKPSAVDELKGKTEDVLLEIISKIKDVHKGELVFVTETELKETTREIKLPDFAEILRPADFRPIAKDFGHEFKVHTDKDITGRSKCSGDISDFVKQQSRQARESR